MASLSAAQITAVAAGAGFTGPDLQTAVAIALAESGGNPSIIGDSGNSYGLWQINIPAHPNYSGPALLNPQANAAAAYAIYSTAGDSFQPWSTYNSGAYQAFMPAVPPAPPSSSPVIDVGSTDVTDDESDDADLTDTAAPAQASLFGNIPTSTILILTGAAIGAYLLTEFLDED
jgi:hypothetical protein